MTDTDKENISETAQLLMNKIPDSPMTEREVKTLYVIYSMFKKDVRFREVMSYITSMYAQSIRLSNNKEFLLELIKMVKTLGYE
jgi:hypothetical protein